MIFISTTITANADTDKISKFLKGCYTPTPTVVTVIMEQTLNQRTYSLLSSHFYHILFCGVFNHILFLKNPPNIIRCEND